MLMKDFFILRKSKLLLFTLLAMLVGGVSPAWADELTICDGSATNTYVPLYGYYADTEGSKSEFIIPKDIVEDLAGGTISNMKFFLSSSPSAAWTATWEIFMREVDDASYTSAAFLDKGDNSTTVYTGTLDATSGSMTVSFTNNFSYSGNKNLLVGIYMTAKGTNYPSATFAGGSYTNACIYKYGSYGSATRGNFIPKIEFTYNPVAGTISKPKALVASDITYEGTTLSWTAGSDETEWEIAYNTTGDTPAVDGNYTSVSTNPTTTISGLEAETTYYAFVRAKKANGYSKWSDKLSFTTTERYPIPTDLAISNLTATSATLTWTSGVATSWEVAINTTGVTPTEAGTVVNAATYDFSSLTTETTYYAFVRVKDGDNYSAWSAACEFTPSAYTYLTVNNGTVENNYIPIYANGIWSSTKVASQFLILSTALTDMVNCELKKMTFFSSSNANDFGGGKFEVYIAEVTNTTVSSTKDWTEMTKVYNEGKLSVNNGKMTIVFDNPFEYKGGNLLVGIKQTVKDQNGTNLNWYGLSTSSNMSRYITGAENKKFSPKVTIGYQEKTGSELKVFDGETELETSPASFDFGLAAEGDTHTFTLKNTAATPYVATISSTNLTVDPTEVTPTADGVTFTVAMPANDITNKAVVITPAAASGLEAFTINVSGTVRNTAKEYQSGFSALPSGWTVDGTSWSYSAANGATTNAWYINQGTLARLKTPLLTIADGEKFIVEAKGNSDGYQHVQLQYSTDGTTWTNLGDELELTSSFKSFTVVLPATVDEGKYYIGLLVSQASIRMFYGGEVVSGANFAINTDGSTQNFGSVKFNATAEKTYTITNSGNANLVVKLAGDENFTVAGNTLLFTNNLGWSTVKVWAWDAENNNLTGADWPGVDAIYYGKNSSNEDQYAVVVPKGAAGILLNNGNDEQTVDITNFNVEGYWFNGSKDGSGHYYATSWGSAPTILTVAKDGGSASFDVKMNTASSGDKSGNVTLSFTAINVESPFTIPCTGNVKDENYLYVDFADGFPSGWQVGADWDASSGSAVQSSTTTASALVTTPLTVAENETMSFKVKRADTGTKSLKVRYSVDGGVTWNETNYGSDFGSSFETKVLTGVPAGTVIVEFLGNNIILDDIEGFTKATKPALAVTEGTAAIANGDTKDFGFLNANGSATYTVKNIGNDVLKAAIAGDGVTVSPANIEVAAGETADITVTMAYAAPYGTKTGKMTIDSEDAWISDFVVNFTAELVDPTAFVEDFTSGQPAGWYLDTWTVSNGEASINYGTAKAMITEKIGAEEGKNTLSFDTKLAYDYGYGTYTLNVFISSDRKNWGEAKKTVTLTDAVQTVTLDALADGEYYVKFEASNAIIDNIKGVKKLDAPAHDLYLVSATLPTDEITPLDTYTATVKVASLRADETVAAELYFGDTKVAEKTAQSIANGATETFTLEATGIAAGTYEVYAKVYNADASVETDKVSVTVADKTELAITEFEAIESTVQTDNENNFIAEFNVTVKNTGSTTIDAGNIGINIVDASNAAYANVTKTNETVFLAPGEYTNDNAKLFIYRWSTDTDSEWGEFTKLSDNLYSADLNGKAKFIVVRKASDATSGFDGAWNQSADLTAADGICFTFQSWGSGNDNFAAGNEALIPNNATAKFKVTVAASAGEGGNMSFKAQEDVTSTYSSSATVLVKAKPATISVEMGTYGFTTFASAYSLDLSNLPAGLTAYKATVEGASVKFTKLEQSVPANTGLLLKGTGYQSYNIPTATSAEVVTGNDFLVNDGTTVVTSDASNYIFVLKKNSDLEFVKYTGTAPLPSNKAYLNVPATNFTGGARLSVSFDDEVATGIESVRSFNEANEAVYNLQGQRVMNAKKGGLYIVNGKKTVLK